MTVGEMVEHVIKLLAVAAITKLMPHQVANHVKDSKPEKLAEATSVANELFTTEAGTMIFLEKWTNTQDGGMRKHGIWE